MGLCLCEEDAAELCPGHPFMSLPPTLHPKIKGIVLHNMEQDLGLEEKREQLHVVSANKLFSHFLFVLRFGMPWIQS